MSRPFAPIETPSFEEIDAIVRHARAERARMIRDAIRRAFGRRDAEAAAQPA